MPANPFAKGNKLGGKSKEQCKFESKCREYLDEKGWAAIEEMAQDKDVRVKMWALDKMMDRGFGRAKESLDVTTRDESSRSPDELADRIGQIIASEAAGSDGVGQPSRGTA